MLDQDAGRAHSAGGAVRSSLGRILARHRELVLAEPPAPPPVLRPLAGASVAVEGHWSAAQARRYLEAAYGPSVWQRAPESFPNALERWVWSVAKDALAGRDA